MMKFVILYQLNPKFIQKSFSRIDLRQPGQHALHSPQTCEQIFSLAKYFNPQASAERSARVLIRSLYELTGLLFT